uniref:Uncharacterized protein n=1 Tax=Fagus sylvatica TaxID=28930 RepID=A0A2N9GZU8_FAGSY
MVLVVALVIAACTTVRPTNLRTGRAQSLSFLSFCFFPSPPDPADPPPFPPDRE